MRLLLTILRIATALCVLAVLAPLTLWAAPDFEARFFPVLTRQSIDGIDLRNEGRLVCWTWHFDKVRSARIVNAGWTLRDGDVIYPYERVRTVADSEAIGPGLPERPVKAGRWSRKCMDVPSALVGRTFLLTGFVEYSTARTGSLWTVRQATPGALIQ